MVFGGGKDAEVTQVRMGVRQILRCILESG